jgi:hypothetical protein
MDDSLVDPDYVHASFSDSSDSDISSEISFKMDMFHSASESESEPSIDSIEAEVSLTDKTTTQEVNHDSMEAQSRPAQHESRMSYFILTLQLHLKAYCHDKTSLAN